jgi:hypothetical protein
MNQDQLPLLLSLLPPDGRDALLAKLPQALSESAQLTGKMRRLGPEEFALVSGPQSNQPTLWGRGRLAFDLVLHAKTAAGKLTKRFKIDRERGLRGEGGGGCGGSVVN